MTNEQQIIKQVDIIKYIVAKKFNVDPCLLSGKRGSRQLSDARYIAVLICYDLIEITMQDLAALFGKNCHSIVRSAKQQIEDRIKTERGLKRKIEDVTILCKVALEKYTKFESAKSGNYYFDIKQSTILVKD